MIVTVAIVMLKMFTDDTWCNKLSDCLLGGSVLSAEYFQLIFEILIPALIAADIIIAVPILINAHRKKKNVYSKIQSDYTLFLVAFALVLNFVVSSIVDIIPTGTTVDQYNNLINLAFSGNIIFVVLSTGIFAPIIEELIFRYCICSFYKNKKVAIFVSALLFGLAHMNLIQSSYAFVIGLLLAWLFVRTENLMVPTIIHLTVNLSSVIFEYINNYWIYFTVSLIAFVFVMHSLNNVLKQNKHTAVEVLN